MSLPPNAPDSMADPEMTRWFAKEVQPHEAALRGWLRSRYPTLSDRDDVVQESYMRLWRAKSRGPVNSPRAMLFVIARNLVLNHYRQLKRNGDVGEMDVSEVLDEGADVSDQIARKQEYQLLNEAIQALPEKCREVFVLRRFYGMSQKDIAARMGIAEKTVEAQNFKAIKRCMEFFREVESGERASQNSPIPFVGFQRDPHPNV